MKTDGHAECRRMIDDLLVMGAAAVQEEPWMREHLRECPECQAYLDASHRVVASFGSLSFAVDPVLQTRVFRALERRGKELTAPLPDRRQVAWACGIAVVLTVAGSLLELRCGDLLATVLHLRPMAVRQDLLLFWIAPSLLVLLLFPMVPVLAERRERMA